MAEAPDEVSRAGAHKPQAVVMFQYELSTKPPFIAGTKRMELTGTRLKAFESCYRGGTPPAGGERALVLKH